MGPNHQPDVGAQLTLLKFNVSTTLTPRNNHPMTADRGSRVMVTHKALLLGPTRLGGAGSTILGNSLQGSQSRHPMKPGGIPTNHG